MNRPTASGKTTLPRHTSVLARPRLLKRLDVACRHGLAWVMAPPGSGKTTLVGDYVATRDGASLRYRLDGEDRDPATFFHYLSQAAQRVHPRARPALPIPTRERQLDLATFSRRYFETLAARAQEAPSWVFDDFREIPDDGPTCTLLWAAMEAARPDLAIVIISRHPPPAMLARLRVHGRLAVIEGGALALTPDEALALARTRDAALGEAEVAEVHAATGGLGRGAYADLRGIPDGRTPRPSSSWPQPWVAFRLLHARDFRGPAGRHPGRPLDHIARAQRDAIDGRPSLGPRARGPYPGPACCGAITSPHDPETYAYHALFRAFLRGRAAHGLGAERLAQTRIVAAHLLDEAQAPDLAATLLVEAQDWAALEDLCIRHAPALLAQGRAATVMRWIAAMPTPPLRETSPWLLYWQGACETSGDAAHELFARAYALFEGPAHARGRFLSWAGVAESYYLSRERLASSDAWLGELDALIACCPTFPDDRTERRVVSAVVALMVIRRPQHTMLPVWVRRLRKLIDETREASDLPGNGPRNRYAHSKGMSAPGSRSIRLPKRPTAASWGSIAGPGSTPPRRRSTNATRSSCTRRSRAGPAPRSNASIEACRARGTERDRDEGVATLESRYGWRISYPPKLAAPLTPVSERPPLLDTVSAPAQCWPKRY